MTDEPPSDDRVEELESKLSRVEERLDALDDRDGVRVPRRGVLAALGGAGLVGLGSGSASADPQGRIGTPDRPVSEVHTVEVRGTETIQGPVTDNSTLTSLTEGALDVSGGELDIADEGVKTSKLEPGAISSGQIADKSITGDQIADDTVTASEIDANAVTNDELNLDADTSGVVKNSGGGPTLNIGAVQNDELASGAVDTDELAEVAVEGTKVANNTLDPSHIATGDGLGGDGSGNLAADVTGPLTTTNGPIDLSTDDTLAGDPLGVDAGAGVTTADNDVAVDAGPGVTTANGTTEVDTGNALAIKNGLVRVAEDGIGLDELTPGGAGALTSDGSTLSFETLTGSDIDATTLAGAGLGGSADTLDVDTATDSPLTATAGTNNDALGVSTDGTLAGDPLSVVAGAGVTTANDDVAVDAGDGLAAGTDGLDVDTATDSPLTATAGADNALDLSTDDTLAVGSGSLGVDAGSGLDASGTSLAVGAGDGVTTANDDVAVEAGDGLAASATGLDVGVTAPLTAGADALGLSTDDTLDGDPLGVADTGVDTAQLNGGAVTSAKIASTADVGDNDVLVNTSNGLNFQKVGAPQLGVGSQPGAGVLRNGGTNAMGLNVGVVEQGEIDQDAVTNANIGDGAVTSTEIANDTVTGTNLTIDESNTGVVRNSSGLTVQNVQPGDIAADVVGAQEVSADETVDGALFNAGGTLSFRSVKTGDIEDGTITTGDFDANGAAADQTFIYNGSAWTTGEPPVGSNTVGTDELDNGATSNDGDVFFYDGATGGWSLGTIDESSLTTPFGDLATLFGSTVSTGADLDLGGNTLIDGNGDVTLGSGLDLNGNTLTDGNGDVSLGSALDLNGNSLTDATGDVAVTSDTSVTVDVDANADSTGTETFAVTSNGGTTSLLTVNEGGEVDVVSGDLDLNGNTLTDSAGDVTVTSDTSVGVDIDANNDTSGTETFAVTKDGGATSLLTVNESGEVSLNDGVQTGTGTNVAIDTASNQLRVETSSARYKTDIEPLSPEPGRVLDLEPRSFEYEATGDEDVGLVAEEVASVLPSIVLRDEEGRPDAVQYDRLGVFLVPEVGENRDRVADVESRVDERDERVDELEADLAAAEAKLADRDDRIDRLEERVRDRDDRVDALADEVADLRETVAEQRDLIEEQRDLIEALR